MTNPKRCGAKRARGGEPCKRWALENGRCRFHGGLSTGPKNQRGNKNAARPGAIYSKYLSDEERAIIGSIEIGSLDDEIKLCRTRLCRALAAETQEPELSEITEREGVEAERKSKTKDYHHIINTLLARIESLEARRLALISQDLDNQIKTKQLEALAQDNGETPERKRIVFETIDGRLDSVH
ncbi:MAG: HGGxSTG domain-containing protein [Methylococcales bacterium]|nr:HGGxSTG domain-containing protein [Methylococcales bacterium]